MTYIVITAWFPTSKRREIAQKALEVAQKFPPDSSLGTIVVPGALLGSPNGIKSIAITDVREGKLEEAMNRVTEMIQEYLDIEGFNYQVETAMTQPEAMATLGL
ncbi:MAG: hypothetical protein ACW98F_00600 [Candidatus Hodarchaeales archaeon]|jgi:hypothetical protein